MKYGLDLSPKLDVSAPSASGASVFASTPASGSAPAAAMFLAWQPSTWPKAPAAVDEQFILTLKTIFEEAILAEINNVIEDATHRTGSLEHRGHVVAIALMCALDAVASYGYRHKHVKDFIANHFPHDYRAHADTIYELYRCTLVHSWNLFEATILPEREPITSTGGTISFGLLNFFEALVFAVGNYLERLEADTALQANTLARYAELRQKARP